jgi:transcriptional regulator with XRE-family HTH domain
MERGFNSQDIISEHLVKYLAGTRLSMSQVAEKWGVSTALLSQIKNKKKVPGLELGLKILREGKADIEIREGWIKRETGEDGEVAKLQYDIERERNEIHMTEKVARQMQSDRLMADIFMDISYVNETGLDSQTIIREYGKLGLQKAAKLIGLGLVKLHQGKYIKNNFGKPHFFTPKTSFEFVGDVLKEQAKKLETGDFRGEFNFELNDVPEEVYEELKSMHKDYVTQVIEKIQMYQKPNLKGGRRVIVQMLTSALKCILFIIMITAINISGSWAGDEGNGLAGGASGLERDFDINRVFRAGHDNIIFEGKTWPYKSSIQHYAEKGQSGEYRKWGV